MKTGPFFRSEVEKFQYFQFPKWLLREPYSSLSSDAKIIYTVLFDRLSLSLKSEWFDSEGKVYVYYTNKELAKDLQRSEKTVIKAKKELFDMGLLSEIRQGLSKPNRIYIYAPTMLNKGKSTVQEEDKGSVQELEKVQSRTENFTVQELEKVQTTKTDITKSSNSSCINNSEENSLKQLLKDFEVSFGRLLSPFEIEDIQKYVTEEGFDIDLIREALKEAVFRGKPVWNYIKAILRNWKTDGLLTVAAVQARKQEQEVPKNNQPPSSDFLAAMDLWKE